MNTDAAGPELAASGVRFAPLFGSRATGGAGADSDADIAIVTAQPLDLLAESGLAGRLAEIADVPSVDLGRAPLRLIGRVLAEGRPIFGRDEPGRVEFEVRSRSGYFDFLPTQRAHRDVDDFLDDARVHAATSTGLPDLEVFATAVAAPARPGDRRSEQS